MYCACLSVLGNKCRYLYLGFLCHSKDIKIGQRDTLSYTRRNYSMGYDMKSSAFSQIKCNMILNYSLDIFSAKHYF